MLTLKIGNFPGELKEYAIIEGTSVRGALDMAGITIGAEQEVKLDGEAVSLDDVIDSGNLLLVTKKLKGAIF